MSEKARLHCRPGCLVWGRLRNAVKEAKWRAIRLVAQVVRDIEGEAHAARMASGI